MRDEPRTTLEGKKSLCLTLMYARTCVPLVCCTIWCCVFVEPVGKYIYVHVSFVPVCTCIKPTTTCLGVGFSVAGTQ